MPGFSKNMAGTLQIGDILIKNNGFEKVFTIERSNPITNLQLYNFIVDGTNSYYANGYLVHNKTAKYDCPANTGCCPICDEIYGSSSEDQVKCYNSCVTKCEAGQNYYNIQV
ncbi:hypothetical protein FACS1894176_01560 [Bacteroidia bacterium]|nr:hypothetical protein FACS189428_6100 [Clostridia bacterium]GHV24692.1 hypothetical protein FACS1894176_01560 [Bacteroidia bacterium]